MDIPACSAAKSAQVTMVTSLYGTRSQEKQIYKANHVKLFSLLCLEKLMSLECLAGLQLRTQEHGIRKHTQSWLLG